MSSPDDHEGGGSVGDAAPRLTPTAVDPVSPFDSTTVRRDLSDLSVAEPAMPRETQPSDPPTTLVRRDSFRELPPGSVVGETYEIDARLGAGAMGEVYAARHMKLGKRVAVKVIRQRLSEDAAAIERFAREARTLAQIQHPAIVAVEHVGELVDGRAYFVMEYLRGESLFERLARGRVPLAEALRVLDQMARGLEAAHAEGITHRDLKPENTFLVHLPSEPPIVKLVDFGLAKLADSARERVDCHAESTGSGVTIGTPMYMSPEQARGPDVDHRTDIYALGCVAYELLLGVPPFPHARTAPELYAAHLHESPPLPRSIWPEIPPQLDLALFAMLAKDPEHRPTLAQVRAVIAAARTSTPSQGAATELVGPRPSRPRARSLTAAAVALVALAALAIGVAVGPSVTGKTRADARREPVAAPNPPPAARQTTEHVAPAAPATGVINTIDAADAADATDAKREAVAPPPDPRKTGGGAHPGAPRTPPPKAAGSAAVAAPANPRPPSPPPIADEKPKPKPIDRIDRNQTVNPFARSTK